MLPFLLLPTEIRARVYYNLRSKTPRLEHVMCLDHFEYAANHDILCTSRQIRSEAESVLYQDNTYNHYLERTTSRKTYSSPDAERRLATVITMCPSLVSVHLHIILPFDFETSEPSSHNVTSLIIRMERTCSVLKHHPNLEKVLLSAQKPAPAGFRRIRFQTDGVPFVRGLCTLSEQYKEVLRPLQSLPARIAVVYGAEKPCLDGLNGLSMAGYKALCQYILYTRIDKMFASRDAAVGSSTCYAPGLATGKPVKEGKNEPELGERELKEEFDEEKLSPGAGRSGYAVVSDKAQAKEMRKVEEIAV